MRTRADPAADPRRRDPLAQHLRPRDPADEANADPAQRRATRRRSRRSSTAATSPAGPGPVDEVRGHGRRDPLQAEEGRHDLHARRSTPTSSARLEFRLPPGGNNGLAIRYPGEGDTAYVGMCELQVLDDTAPKYAKLDPRQYHGSAYGMVRRAARLPAARRRVELPGGHGEGLDDHGGAERHRILDADLSTVTSSWPTSRTRARTARPATSASPATTTRWNTGGCGLGNSEAGEAVGGGWWARGWGRGRVGR